MFRQAQLQKQTFKILPQQLQLLGIYHLNTLELDQRITEELAENPLLEKTTDEEMVLPSDEVKDLPQDFQNWEEYGYDDNANCSNEYQHYIHNHAINTPIRDVFNIRTYLKEQLVNINITEEEQKIANFILDSVSEKGFLEQGLTELADDYSFQHGMVVEENLVEQVVKKIQVLDPPGIASSSVQEYFLIQLEQQKSSPIVKHCRLLIRDHYPTLQHRNFEKICTALQLEEDEFSILLKHLATLQLYPLSGITENNAVKETIVPDFILEVEEENLAVELRNQKSTSLAVNEVMLNNLAEAEKRSGTEKSNIVYLKNKLLSAQWFVEAIQTRERNMLAIMRIIVQKQRDFFLSGDHSLLRPMILKDVAEQVGLDISTISRVTCNKYIDTPFGLVFLKELFTEAYVNAAGESISNKAIQLNLKEIIETEDRNHPYNDSQLVKILQNKGLNIARRTIAKYRENMQIPVSMVRRILSKTN